MLEAAIGHLTGGQFQDFVDQLLVYRYAEAFTPTRQHRDRGCDGIIQNHIIVAAYGPETPTLATFRRKIQNDHEKYLQHWKSQYPRWCIIYNGSFTAEMIQFIDGLEAETQKLDRGHLISMIRGFRWPVQRSIALSLGIDEQFLIYDVVRSVVDDLLGATPQSANAPVQSSPPYIAYKIAQNYNHEDGVLPRYNGRLS